MFMCLPTAGEDYKALISFTIILSTAEGRGYVNITIISDDRVEGLERFVVRTDLDDESISTTY